MVLVLCFLWQIIHTRLMLLHDSRNDDGIKSFFQEVHELYIKASVAFWLVYKIPLNPFHSMVLTCVLFFDMFHSLVHWLNHLLNSFFPHNIFLTYGMLFLVDWFCITCSLHAQCSKYLTLWDVKNLAMFSRQYYCGDSCSLGMVLCEQLRWTINFPLNNFFFLRLCRHFEVLSNIHLLHHQNESVLTQKGFRWIANQFANVGSQDLNSLFDIIKFNIHSGMEKKVNNKKRYHRC